MTQTTEKIRLASIPMANEFPTNQTPRPKTHASIPSNDQQEPLAQSASLRTAPKLVNRVSAPPTIPTHVNTSYLKPFVSNATADGSTAGFANCATTAARILSFSPTFSVCRTSNGGGRSL